MKSTYERRNGGSKSTTSKKNDGANATARRKVALKNLEKQLERGGYDDARGHFIPLENVNRVKKEIETLKKKIK